MRKSSIQALLFAVITSLGLAHADDHERHENSNKNSGIQLGPRPFYLVQEMGEGKLKDKLMQCQNGPFLQDRFLHWPSRRGHAVSRAFRRGV